MFQFCSSIGGPEQIPLTRSAIGPAQQDTWTETKRGLCRLAFSSLSLKTTSHWPAFGFENMFLYVQPPPPPLLLLHNTINNHTAWKAPALVQFISSQRNWDAPRHLAMNLVIELQETRPPADALLSPEKSFPGQCLSP